MLILSGGDGQPPLDNTTLGQLFDLTPMEAQVAHLLAEGLRRSQIADRLTISGTTVAFHLRNIFAKTGVQRQAELVALILSALRVSGRCSMAYRAWHRLRDLS